MIIDKVKPFNTDADQEQLSELNLDMIALDGTVKENMPQEEFRPILEKIQAVMDKVTALERKIENRYIESRTHQEIVDDAREIVEAITKEDFKKYVAAWGKNLEKFKDENLKSVFTEESYKNAYNFILYYVRVQLNGVSADKEKTAEIIAFVENKAAEWYPEEQLKLPILQSTGTPKSFISPNTLLSNALRAIDGKGELFGAGPTDLPALNIGGNKEVTIFVNASIENNIVISGKPYTEYDRAVQDAAVTLFVDRKNHNLPPIFDAEMIYRTMTFKTNAERVSPQQRGAVTKSIDKQLKNLYVEADMTSELKEKKLLDKITVNGQPASKFKIKGFLLSATEIEVMSGGKKKTAYLMNEPILYQYAMANNAELITVPGKLLDIKEVSTVNGKKQAGGTSLPNTEKRIAVKFYLLRRIEVMRKDEERAADAYRKYLNRRKRDKYLPVKGINDFRSPKISRTILFDTVFNAAEITAANTKTDSREYILNVLDFWQAMGRIKGYEKRKKGKTTDAVTIEI